MYIILNHFVHFNLKNNLNKCVFFENLFHHINSLIQHVFLQKKGFACVSWA